jgi:CBS domain-containing protein
MFWVYGVEGPTFSGTLEEMYRVRAIAGTRSPHAIGRDTQDMTSAVGPSATHQPNQKAVRAYLAMLPKDVDRGPIFHADQIMQRRVITLQVREDVTKAWRTLRDHHIHQAPVIDDSERLVGIASERDLLTAINIDAGRIVEYLSRQVGDVMSTPVVAATPMTDIRRICEVMIRHDVDGVPIADSGGHLMGFISRGDILRSAMADPPLSLWR